MQTSELNYEEYLEAVAKGILEQLPKKFFGYVVENSTKSILKDIKEFKNEHGEYDLRYREMGMDKSVDMFWEDESTVEEAVDYFLPMLTYIYNCNASVM